MRALCLDTSAYSEFKRGRPEIVDLVSRAARISMPVTVLGELRYGFLRSKQKEKNERELAKFLDHPVVEVLEIDDRAATICAEIMQQLRRAGAPIPSNDVWIAAAAAREGLPVVTYDADFSHIQRISAHILRS